MKESNDSSKNLWWIIGGGAVFLACLCTVLAAAVILGVGFFANSGSSSPATTVAIATTVMTVEKTDEEPILATPDPAEGSPTEESNPPEENVARPTDLDEVDLAVLSEVWSYIEEEFDGDLPTPDRLLESIVNCSVEYTLGEEAVGEYQTMIDEALAKGESAGSSLTDLNLTAYYNVWATLETEHTGDLPTQQQLREATIGCSLEAALNDQFTSYTPPAAAARMREDMSGTFEGIGAFVEMDDEGYFVIVRPMDGQPADLVGLKAGDKIIAVNGENVVGQAMDEVISKVRGPRGTEVTLTVLREGQEPFDVTITRARIEIPIVESELLEEGIAYIHLTQFSRNAEEQVVEALNTLLTQNPQGLIFDLRDNPGGYLDQAIAIGDLFLSEGIIVQERNRTGLNESASADGGDTGEKIPMVVLVNVGSASASEIVAGALKENSRAILIGEITFGKGSVQYPHELSDGGEVRVTIARWYTPDNNTIDGQGITPDIEVPTPEDLMGEDDGQLQRAIEYILTGQ